MMRAPVTTRGFSGGLPVGLGTYRLSKDLEQFTQEQIAEKINCDFEPDKEAHISWFERGILLFFYC